MGDKFSWYHGWLVLILALPTIPAQTLVRVLPPAFWHHLDATLYPLLMTGSQTFESRSSRAQRLHHVRISGEDKLRFGWPLSEEAVATFVRIMRQRGSPWILPVGFGHEGLESGPNHTPQVQGLASYGKVLLGPAPEPMHWPSDRCAILYQRRQGHDGWILSQPMLGYAALRKAQVMFPDGQTRAPSTRLKTSNRRIRMPDRMCFKQPWLSDEEYLERRQIPTESFTDVLARSTSTFARTGHDLRGRLVVLSVGASGSASNSGSNTVRVLASLVHRDYLRVQMDSSQSTSAYLPLLLAIGFLAVALGFGLKSLLWFQSVVLMTLVVVVAVAMRAFSMLTIPTGAFLYTLMTLLASLSLYVYLRKYAVRRISSFQAALAELLSQCNTFEDVKLNTQSVCASEFLYFKIFFLDYDEALYEASSSTSSAMDYLQVLERSKADLDDVLLCEWSHFVGGDQKFATVFTTMKKIPRGKRSVGRRAFSAKVAISYRGRRLGTIEVQAHYRAHEVHFIAGMVNALATELSTHWSRVDALSRQRLRDHSAVAQAAKKEMVRHFLPQQLVRMIDEDRSVSEYLADLLNPEVRELALVQIRLAGYWPTELGGIPPSDVVASFHRFYNGMIDAAGMVAKVKLIGDKIYMHIEERAMTVSGVSTVDVALFVASMFVRDIAKRLEADEHVQDFGLAIDYGTALVGNLGSDTSIDYTAVGRQVDKVDRLEELTSALSAKIGGPKMLISTEARAGLCRFADIPCERIDLPAIGLTVRGFPEVTTVHGLSEETLIELSRSTTLKRLIRS